jgi:PAS domain S-box-containing protein
MKLSPLHSADGLLVTASIRDISARIQLDDKIRFLATIAENIQDPVIATNKEFRIISWNKAAEKVFGWSQEEVLGSIVTDILKLSHLSDGREQYTREFHINGFWQGELMGQTKAGESLNLWMTTNKLKDAQGENIGSLAVMRDITQQRRNEAQIASMARMVENTNEGMYSVTKDFEVLTWNKAAEDIYGFKAEEVIGRSVYDIIRSPMTPDQRAEFRRKIVSSEKWQDELQHFTKDGRLIHILASTSAIKNATGETTGYVSIARDITERKEAENQIEFLATIARSIEDVLMVTDRDFNITKWNVSAERLLGWNEKEMLGKPASVLKVKDLTPNNESVLVSITEKGYWNGESIVHSKAGVPIHFMSTYSTIRDGRNQVSGYLVLARDITAQKMSQDRIRKLALLVESTSEAVISISDKFSINTWNKGAENLFGYTYDEVSGQQLYAVITPDLGKDEQAALSDHALENGFVVDNRYLTCRDNRLLYCSISITAIKNEYASTEGYVVVINDMTKIKQAEEELIQALNKEKDLTEMKNRFVSIASHEFRTPLATIALASGFLKKYTGKLTASQMDEKFKNIEKQIYHMTQLLDDVLMIGKAEAGKLKPVYAEVNGDIFERLGEEAALGRGISHIIKFRENQRPPTFVTDEKLLRNITINLVTNAIKFSPASSEVYLNIDWRHSHVAFSVEDRGIGIPPDELKNLFIPFSRGSNVGAIEGSGLGLSIVKKAVELLNGTIEVTSTVGAGTRFTVILPLKNEKS